MLHSSQICIKRDACIDGEDPPLTYTKQSSMKQEVPWVRLDLSNGNLRTSGKANLAEATGVVQIASQKRDCSFLPFAFLIILGCQSKGLATAVKSARPH